MIEMRGKVYLTGLLLAASLVSGCSGRLERIWTPTGQDENLIRVGASYTTSVSASTKASYDDPEIYKPAENEAWLIPSLKAGIDVNYGLLDADAAGNPVQKYKRTATLSLDGAYEPNQTDPAVYHFDYNTPSEPAVDGKPAEWYGNGMHFFEGAFVPQFGSAIATDQSIEDNYLSLTRYLSVPVDCYIPATIERVRIPFQHRLSRVIAYVLLNQPMRDQGVTITSVTFSKVWVLSGVSDGHPVWVESRKVTPHAIAVNQGLDRYGKLIVGKTDFVMLHHKKNDSYLAPSSPEYSIHYDSSDYEKIVYKGGAPSYDIIVRPTYTDASTVMYDEAGYYTSGGGRNETEIAKIAGNKNRIEFEIKLSNGLQYTKDFVFDLDANYQTVVYLRIEPEAVNYDNSGSQVWIPVEPKDGFYGVNNENGNTLSAVGSSWQRAFRNTSAPQKDITDGSYYDQDGEIDHDEKKDGQYVSDDKWKAAFLAATLGGQHHGDYFILDKDMDLTVPEGFVFTGHLDAQGHTITLTQPFAGLNGTYDGTAGTANLHDQNGQLVPVKGYRAEIMNLVVAGTKLFSSDDYASDDSVTGYVYHCKYSDGTVIPDFIYKSIPSYK